MSERVIVRKEIRECKQRIKEILQEQQKAEQDDKDNINTNNTFTSDDRMYDTENNVLENNQ